jgi:hypothetical protein
MRAARLPSAPELQRRAGAKLRRHSPHELFAGRYFYQLRWLAGTYKRGKLRPDGLNLSSALFPQVSSRFSLARCDLIPIAITNADRLHPRNGCPVCRLGSGYHRAGTGRQGRQEDLRHRKVTAHACHMLGRARWEGSGGVVERLQDGSLLILACVQGAVQVVRTSWLRRHQGTLACGTLATLPAGRLA